MEARIINLRVVSDPTGDLTPIEDADIPFPIRRAFVLHNLQAGARRGGHAHKVLQEVIIAVSGSFDVATVTERGRTRWTLTRPDRGLYVPPGAWRNIGSFSGNAVALVLASTPYDPEDYIRDFGEFLATLGKPPESWFAGQRWREVEAWRK
jgi:hypothetical protein